MFGHKKKETTPHPEAAEKPLEEAIQLSERLHEYTHTDLLKTVEIQPTHGPLNHDLILQIIEHPENAKAMLAKIDQTIAQIAQKNATIDTKIQEINTKIKVRIQTPPPNRKSVQPTPEAPIQQKILWANEEITLGEKKIQGYQQIKLKIQSLLAATTQQATTIATLRSAVASLEENKVQHSIHPPQPMMPPSIAQYQQIIGTLSSLRYERQAKPIKTLVDQLIAQITSLKNELHLTTEASTTHLTQTLALLSRQLRPEDYMNHIKALQGHPNEKLRTLGKIMMLLGSTVLAALGTAIGLGIAIPSAAIVLPVTATVASLTTLLGGISLFSGRATGSYQTARQLAHQVMKVPEDRSIAQPAT